MAKRPLVWTANNAFNHAFSAQVANVTYHVATQDYGYPAHVEARDPRSGLKRLYLRQNGTGQACLRAALRGRLRSSKGGEDHRLSA